MQLKPLLSRLFELGSNLIRRYPGTVALFGFISGVASFVLVERHAGLAKVVALVMLVGWLWLVLESSLREACSAGSAGKCRNRCCAMPRRWFIRKACSSSFRSSP